MVSTGSTTGDAAAGRAASASERVSRPRGVFHALRVADVERLTDDAVAVRFEVPEELRAAYAFAPGQSLTLRRYVDGVEGRRTYSICAPTGAAPRIGVREIPDGLFSTWLVHDVRAGDTLEVQTPGGTFTADPARPGWHLAIVAGSGITPILSIGASVLADPGARMTLLYGNRTAASVMFAEELADLKDRYGPRLELVHVLSREPRDVELFSGRLDVARLRRLLDALVPVSLVDHVWLCGPFAMVTDARALLEELGVDKARVHTELFFVDEPPPEVHRAEVPSTGQSVALSVVLDGRTTTAPVPLDVSVLDAAGRTRADLPYACKGGVCGTCRARVTEGAVDMRRNYALDDDELARGFVLTCQSFPTGEALTVDFDS